MNPASYGPTHATTLLTIDLDAIADNFLKLKKIAAPAGISAVVKANGYGLGIAPVARTLHGAGCRTFFVAHLDEGICLRKILPYGDTEIGVLNGLMPGAEEVYEEHTLLPTLNDLGQVEQWNAYCARKNNMLPASIHFDTGMTRLGLPCYEAEMLFSDPSRRAAFKTRFAMSHMACADMPRHPQNTEQRERFRIVADRMKDATAMLSASSATFLGSDWHFDMIRPGVALFGVAPNAERPNPMRSVVTLTSKILQLQHVDADTGVGYGAAYRTGRPTRLATVAVGYADGYLRCLGNRAKAYMGRHEVPVVGRISMDLVTIDVTDVPEEDILEHIDLIGPRHTVDDLAAEAGTIGYEILTLLGHRYARHYIGGVQ